MVFGPYITPGVVLGVTVSSGRSLVVSLAVNSILNILNKDPELLNKNISKMLCQIFKCGVKNLLISYPLATYSYFKSLCCRMVNTMSVYMAGTRMSTSASTVTSSALSGLQKSSCRWQQSQTLEQWNVPCVYVWKQIGTSTLLASSLMTFTCSSNAGFRRRTLSLLEGKKTKHIK